MRVGSRVGSRIRIPALSVPNSCASSLNLPYKVMRIKWETTHKVLSTMSGTQWTHDKCGLVSIPSSWLFLPFPGWQTSLPESKMLYFCICWAHLELFMSTVNSGVSCLPIFRLRSSREWGLWYHPWPLGPPPGVCISQGLRKKDISHRRDGCWHFKKHTWQALGPARVIGQIPGSHSFLPPKGKAPWR